MTEIKDLPLSSKDKMGLTQPVRRTAIGHLNAMLGTNFALLTKVWGYHWNMKGQAFHPTHLWFNDLYERLIEDVDSIAERVRAMDGIALGSLSDMMKASIIEDHKGAIPTIPDMIRILLSDYEATVKQARLVVSVLNSLNPQDDGDLNFIQDFIMKREKDCWMLRANSSF